MSPMNASHRKMEKRTALSQVHMRLENWAIPHLHVFHNAPFLLPPSKKEKHFPLGTTVIRRRVLPIMAYTGRLLQKGVPFSDFTYMKGG